jgi:hypothetical protein
MITIFRVIRFALIVFVFLSPLRAYAADFPTILSCTVNALANRDFGFNEKAWGGIPSFGAKPDDSKPFTVATKTKELALKQRIFSRLDTPRPVVRMVGPWGPLPEDAAEFTGTVVSRLADSLFIIWQNDYGNKVWLSVIDLAHKRATMSQAFRGITSVGVEVETLDCR